MQSEAQANANARVIPTLSAGRRLDGTIDRGLENPLFFALPCGARLSARAWPAGQESSFINSRPPWCSS
jgi:hypothetical protein